MTDTPETQVETENKVVNLFANGTGAEWVEIIHVKDEDQICPANDVLQAQVDQLKNVVLIGQTLGGGFVLASSFNRLADANLLVDAAKWHLTGLPLE
jgi:hypothetical protein